MFAKRPHVVHAYIDHPLGERHGRWFIDRQNNVALAMEFAAFWWSVTRRDHWVIKIPFVTNLMIADLLVRPVDEDSIRKEHLAAQWAEMDRSDVVLACGSFVSPHMKEGRDRCERRRQAWCDCTSLAPGGDPRMIERHGIDWIEWVHRNATRPIMPYP